jgi:hypothetical protein
MLFDPLLITYQIISLQCFHYLAWGTLLGVFHAVFDLNVSMDHFFTPKYINFMTIFGLIETASVLLTGITG